MLKLYIFIATLHQCKIHFCPCFEELHTLLQYDLWPATPKKPTTVIAVPLLHTFVSLQLEGKISLLSFCDGMSWKNGFLDSELVSLLRCYFIF